MSGGLEVKTDETQDVSQVFVNRNGITLGVGDGKTIAEALDALSWPGGEYHPDPRACDALSESAAWDGTEPGAPDLSVAGMETESLSALVMKSETHLPPGPWTVEAFDLAGEGRPVAAIQDAAGDFVIASVEGSSRDGAATLQALSFIRQAIPVLANRAQRFEAVIQALVDAIDDPACADAAVSAAEAIGFRAKIPRQARHEGAPFCPQCGRNMKPIICRVPNPANKKQVGRIPGERADLVPVQGWVCKCPPVVIG